MATMPVELPFILILFDDLILIKKFNFITYLRNS
jgi:hypothetical protein